MTDEQARPRGQGETLRPGAQGERRDGAGEVGGPGGVRNPAGVPVNRPKLSIQGLDFFYGTNQALSLIHI